MVHGHMLHLWGQRMHIHRMAATGDGIGKIAPGDHIQTRHYIFAYNMPRFSHAHIGHKHHARIFKAGIVFEH